MSASKNGLQSHSAQNKIQKLTMGNASSKIFSGNNWSTIIPKAHNNPCKGDSFDTKYKSCKLNFTQLL